MAILILERAAEQEGEDGEEGGAGRRMPAWQWRGRRSVCFVGMEMELIEGDAFGDLSMHGMLLLLIESIVVQKLKPWGMFERREIESWRFCLWGRGRG